MGHRVWLKKSGNRNWLMALAAAVILALFTGGLFDYYYDLNDDVLMKDILAGVYTGVPESRNIQMLWPVSALISLFYRAAGNLPWYGLFLCLCHYGCFFLILRRSLTFCRTWKGKLAVSLAEGLLMAALFLEHLVYAQYTVTCTLLGGTAAFLFYTTDIELDQGIFVRKNVPAVLLVFAAYLIRSEMLLLVLPMICVAGAAKWGSEKKIFTGEHARKYLTVIGLILWGILVGQVSDRIARNSREWRDFTAFFDNRTELYDFQEPPAYKEHRAFYESIGLSESEKILFDNYNFGMDEEIDHVMVGEIAVYAAENKSAEKPFFQELPRKLREYAYRFLKGPKAQGSDYPWNYAVILGYILVFLTAVFPEKESEQNRKSSQGEQTSISRTGTGENTGEDVRKESGKKRGNQKPHLGSVLGIGWKLAFLFGVRTLLWMYILMRERAPERITHSLYLMELCILGAMLFEEYRRIRSGTAGRICAGAALAGFVLLALCQIPDSVESVSVRQTEREETNRPYQELYDHLSDEENRDNFYLIDVFSTVAYSEKMFENVDNTLDNYDIMGGWACKSPLQRKKLALFGIENMEQALREREDVYFVRKISEDMQWLVDYYEGHGTPVDVKRMEVVADQFEIYAVSAR